MEKRGALNFKVGQLAEMKTFEEGFRGAWFRCKISDINVKKNKILLEYLDFPEEEITWLNIYEMPPYGRKSKQIQKQLMVRPQYPPIYYKNEMPPVESISQVSIMIDATWKVGDLVDWFKDDCYWSGRVIKLLTDDKLQIELPMPPAGEGLAAEPALDALCKDLRPSLNWSPEKGWSLPTNDDGETTCSVQLVYPSNQDVVVAGLKSEASAVVNASSSCVNSSTDVNACEEKVVEVKMEDADVASVTNCSSESISTLQDAEDKSITKLNIEHEETLESCVVDLEELANKIKWMKSILLNNHDATSSSSSWEFASR